MSLLNLNITMIDRRPGSVSLKSYSDTLKPALNDCSAEGHRGRGHRRQGKRSKEAGEEVVGDRGRGHRREGKRS